MPFLAYATMFISFCFAKDTKKLRRERMPVLAQFKQLITRQAVRMELGKYGIDLLHYIPGRVRLGLKNWKGETLTLKAVIKDIESDPDVISVTYSPQTKTLLIYYNHDAVKREHTQQNWFALLKKYT